jgi:hypothetical protein
MNKNGFCHSPGLRARGEGMETEEKIGFNQSIYFIITETYGVAYKKQ